VDWEQCQRRNESEAMNNHIDTGIFRYLIDSHNCQSCHGFTMRYRNHGDADKNDACTENLWL